MNDLNRVKDLNKDVARRALKRAVVNNSSTTCTMAYSPRSRCSLSPPPSSLCHASASCSRDNDVMANDRTTQRLHDILDRCPLPSERVADDQTIPVDGQMDLNEDDVEAAHRAAWFLPLRDSQSSCRQKARHGRTSTLGDIDECLDETIGHSYHPVVDVQMQDQSVPQPIIAWPSDSECDDKDEVSTEKLERDIHAAAASVECTETTRSPNSDPAVSVDAKSSHYCTPVAGGVQSDFVLSSTTRPFTTPYPREAVCKMRSEGDHTTNICCPLSSAVCDSLGDIVVPADMSGDCCPPQSSFKLKLNEAVSGVDNEYLARNNNVTCWRIDKVVQDSCNEVKRCTDKVTNCGTSSTAASGLQKVQRTNDSCDYKQSVREMSKTTNKNDAGEALAQAHCQSDSKQVHAGTSRSQVVDKQQPSVDENFVTNNKSCRASSPDTVKLLAELISKISELATRQDQLERITPTCSRTMANHSSQTEDQQTAPVVQSGTGTSSLKPSSVVRNKPGRNVTIKQDESFLKQTRKLYHEGEHSLKSKTKEQKISSQKSNAPEAQQTIHTTPTNDDCAEPIKLTKSSAGQQHNDVGVAAERHQPPGQAVQQSPLSAFTDNIIHIVRGSSALDELTVEDMVHQFSELCHMSDESAARQPATEILTESHSQILDQASIELELQVRNASLRRRQSPSARQANRQHSSQRRDDKPRPQDIRNDSHSRHFDRNTTQKDREVSPRPRHDKETHQHADIGSLRNGCDQDNSQHSHRPSRASKTTQEIISSASSLPRSMRPDKEQHRASDAERCQQNERSQRFNTADNPTIRRMQYVLYGNSLHRGFCIFTITLVLNCV